MNRRIIDGEISLVPYYSNLKTALTWYQDLQVCKQVDNRDHPYDMPLLRGMYRYLKHHGDLFYIKYRGRLCGDVCLTHEGEVCIVIARPWQNRHIGRRVISGIIEMAREKGMSQLTAEIYTFNQQSRVMFQSMGFQPVDETHFALTLSS